MVAVAACRNFAAAPPPVASPGQATRQVLPTATSTRSWHSQDYAALTIGDRRHLMQSSWRSQFVSHGEVKDVHDHWAPAQRPLPPSAVAQIHVEPAKDVKRMHLHGNVGVITNPQPSLTDNVKSFLEPVLAPSKSVAVPLTTVGATSLRYRAPASGDVAAGGNTSPLSYPARARARKVFEQSSALFDASRHLSASTSSPRHDLYDARFSTFPYVDSSLDQHVVKKPQVLAEDSEPVGSSVRAPRVKFEPPARPGACFRRKSERNFSDLFGVESLPGTRVAARADANQLSCISFQDARTEVARRNGELRRRPQAEFAAERMRSTPVLGNGDGSKAAVQRPSHVGASLGDASPRLQLQSPRTEAWQRYYDDMGSRAFGGDRDNSGQSRATCWSSSPRLEREASTCTSETPLRFGCTPPLVALCPPHGGASPPRSPRAVLCGDHRGRRLSDADAGTFTERLGCKAVARERFRRHMSSDTALLFGSGPT